MSKTDSETKPVGALWIIAGFTTAENCSEPDAEMPCHPWDPHSLLPGITGEAEMPRRVPPARRCLMGLGGAVPRQDLGI